MHAKAVRSLCPPSNKEDSVQPEWYTRCHHNGGSATCGRKGDNFSYIFSGQRFSLGNGFLWPHSLVSELRR